MHLLKNKAEVPAPESRQFLFPHGDQILSFVKHLPGGGTIHATQGIQQGGLSGTGDPHDHGKFPLVQLQIQTG